MRYEGGGGGGGLDEPLRRRPPLLLERDALLGLADAARADERLLARVAARKPLAVFDVVTTLEALAAGLAAARRAAVALLAADPAARRVLAARALAFVGERRLTLLANGAEAALSGRRLAEEGQEPLTAATVEAAAGPAREFHVEVVVRAVALTACAADINLELLLAGLCLLEALRPRADGLRAVIKRARGAHAAVARILLTHPAEVPSVVAALVNAACAG